MTINLQQLGASELTSEETCDIYAGNDGDRGGWYWVGFAYGYAKEFTKDLYEVGYELGKSLKEG